METVMTSINPVAFFRRFMVSQSWAWDPEIDEEVTEALNDPERALDMANQLLLLGTLRDHDISVKGGKLFYITILRESVVHGTTIKVARNGYKILKAAYIGGHVAMLQRDAKTKRPDLIIWNGTVRDYPHGSVDTEDQGTLLQEVGGEPCWKINAENTDCIFGRSQTLVCNGTRGPTFDSIFEVLDTGDWVLYSAREIGRGKGMALVQGTCRVMTAFHISSPITSWGDGAILSRQKEVGGIHELVHILPDDEEHVLEESERKIEYRIIQDELIIILHKPTGVNDEIIYRGLSLFFQKIEQVISPPSRPDLLIVSGVDIDGVDGVWVNFKRVVTGRRCGNGTASIDKDLNTLILFFAATETQSCTSERIDLTKFGLGPKDR
jgi:hypothetical protein